MADHTIVQAVYQEVSNLNKVSNEVETHPKETNTPTEANATQSTMISTVKQSQITTESSGKPDTYGISAAVNITNEALVTSPNDTTTPIAALLEKEADDTLT
jgi:hypothetical protein